jgi:hypothetical protein
MREAFGHPIRDPRDDHAAIACADEDNVMEVLIDQNIHDVADVRFQINAFGEEMNPLSETC